MVYLSLENVSKSFGEKILFENIDLAVNEGQKIALVAKNGSGKTTLLRVIAGEEAPEGERAKVFVQKSIRIGYLSQEPAFYEKDSVLDAALDSDNPIIQAIKNYEHAMLHGDDAAIQAAIAKMEDHKAWDFEARIKEVLTKLNISDFSQTVGTLSGGQRKRLALAKLIIDEPEMLILDEPTNHLDLDMIEWLETYLAQAKLTVFMVTHDRYFLERVCNEIIELDNGRVYRYTGNYADFLEKKTSRQENEAVVHEKNRKLLKRELDWVNRMPKARGTKAKSRVDAFFELKAEVNSRKVDEQMQIDIKGQRLGKKILELHHVSKAFGDFKILDGFSYKFKKGDRVGIVGPNGVGKTTFLDILTQKLKPDEGKVVVGGNTVFGYYTQEGIQLDDDKRVIEVIQDIAEYIPLEKGQKLTAAALLERFLFSRKQQQVYVSQLSGGERRRLHLLTILMENPNFLILDEPTNDLDIITLNVMEDFLMDFPGCVLMVSHDRYFMDKLVDHVFAFEGQGVVRDFPGNYTIYREKKLEAKYADKPKTTEEKAPPKQRSEPVKGLSQEQNKEVRRLESQINKLERRKAEIMEAFNDTGLSTEAIQELSEELGQVNTQIEEKELRWMELAELA